MTGYGVSECKAFRDWGGCRTQSLRFGDPGSRISVLRALPPRISLCPSFCCRASGKGCCGLGICAGRPIHCRGPAGPRRVQRTTHRGIRSDSTRKRTSDGPVIATAIAGVGTEVVGAVMSRSVRLLRSDPWVGVSEESAFRE